MFVLVVMLLLHPVYEAAAEVWLESGQLYEANDSNFNIYCHESSNKSIISVWKSVYVELRKLPTDYILFGGDNTSDVQNQYSKHSSSWLPVFHWKHATIIFPSFSQYCVGISSVGTYAIQLTVRNINYWKVLQTLVGLLLFLTAPTLSRNVVFYYATGMSFGLIASTVIIVFLISKLMPKKIGAYSVLLFGWSALLYCFQLLWENLHQVIRNHSNALLAYFGVTAIISFVICYIHGPVENPRTLNIIQWALQFIALLLIFFSSEYREASTALIIVLVVSCSIPSSWISKVRTVWKRYFPPKVQLLTEDEYIRQANAETKQALQKLKTYCNSPECNPWKTICTLKDPIRFAKFIEGESHLTDEEILEYNSRSFDSPYDDFSEDESDN